MPTSAMTRSLVILAAGLVILALGVGAWLWSGHAQRGIATLGAITASGRADIGGPFELIDQTGATRDDTEFHGRFMLLYFGYTYCPDVCPTSLLAMSQALDRLAEGDAALASQVVPIFITIDPARDTVAVMRDYAPNFHPDLVALTGGEEQIAKAAKGYRVFYAKASDDSASDYLMDHSGFIYLMGPDGGYLAHFGHDASAEEMAETLGHHVGS